jgi:hypothetical protein
MESKQKVSSAVQDYLKIVKAVVNSVNVPLGTSPVEIPNFADLEEAAGKLDTTRTPEKFMWIIQALLGRASSVGMDAPTPDYKLSFPDDHRIHTEMGLEWYWVGCHLNVTDQNGNKGRVSILSCFQKIRSVGHATQVKQRWTDEETTVGTNICTVTVDMPKDKGLYRRNPNDQWPLKGGNLKFSGKGEDFFLKCGPDSLFGSVDVLPLNLIVDDGDNIQINITFTNNTFVNTKSSFFLQGNPVIGGNGGTGITPYPTPGIYYSWPQVLVSGTVTVGGNTYTIDSGTGWIDHQLMMQSLSNPDQKIHPIPFIEDPKPYNGWVWQFFNLEDKGQAFAGAGFILGDMIDNPKMDYGYFLQPDGKGGWTAIFINGSLLLTDTQEFPAICNNPKDSTMVKIPIKRSYSNIENIFLGDPLSGNAAPWYSDGTFNNPNGSLCGESPADYVDNSGHYSNGLGYLETVGFQKVDEFRAYALGFLQGDVLEDPITLPKDQYAHQRTTCLTPKTTS